MTSLYEQIKVSEAIEKHKALIATLRIKCKEEIALDSKQFDDDLFLVRFCLSHKGDEAKTIEALKESIAFRFKNREILAKLATGWEHPDEKKLREVAPAGYHGGLRDGSVLFIIRGGLVSADRIFAHCTEDEVRNGVIFSKEILYAMCDKKTRETGTIKKVVSVMDLSGGSVFDVNRRMINLMGSVSKQESNCYPNLIGRAVLFRPFGQQFLRPLMALGKMVLPASMFEKISIAGATNSSSTEDIKLCPYTKDLFALDELPSFLGGNCRCQEKGGCIAGVSNDRKEKIEPPKKQQQQPAESVVQSPQ